jgi:hypothetical protein
MCNLNIFPFLDLLFYFSVFLVLAEELMQDYFVGPHFRLGIKMDKKDFTSPGLEDINFVPGEKAKTKDSIYYCAPDGKSCLFRNKHKIYNPFFMPFHLKGEAIKTDRAWRVNIRMNLGFLLFLLLGLGRYVHPAAGLLGAVGGFFLIKIFGLPHMWEYWEQMSNRFAQGRIKPDPSLER